MTMLTNETVARQPIHRPRFIREAAVVPFAGGLLVDGAPRVRALRGWVATDVLPKLLPLLDGTRDLEEIEAALPDIPRDHVRRAVSLLSANGLVESAPLAPAPDPRSEETLAFLRRLSDGPDAGRLAYQRLQASAAAIVGVSDSSVSMERLLIGAGVGEVTVIRADDLEYWTRHSRRRLDRSLVISLSNNDEERDAQRALSGWCRSQELSWLRGSVDAEAGWADVGPLFCGSMSPCHACFLRMRRLEGREHAKTRPLVTSAVAFWAGMLATEAVYVLGGVGSRLRGRTFRRYDLTSGRVKDLHVCRIPGCVSCRALPHVPGSEDSADTIDTAMVFEDGIGADSRLSSVELHAPPSSHGFVQNLETKRAPLCRQVALPSEIDPLPMGALEALGSDPAKASAEVTRDQLSALLKMTAGLRSAGGGPDLIKRWMATAGNLGSVELYVVARGVTGLDDGLYLYQARDHTLASLQWRDGSLSPASLMERVLARDVAALPRALVIFTGAFHRIARKYKEFGYRLVNLDAGAAIRQMHVAAAGLNVRAWIAPRWPDDLLEDQLRLESFNEQVTAVVALGGAPGASAIQSESVPLRAGSPHSLKSSLAFNDDSLSETLTTLVRESRIRESEMRGRGFAVPSFLQRRGDPAGEAIPLPAPHRRGRPLGAVLSARRSLRQFAAAAVGAAELGTLLEHAHAFDVSQWATEHREWNGLTFTVIAQRVDGIAQGVYEYRPATHGLAPMAPLAPDAAADLFVQGDLAGAPLQLLVVANLAAACARYGAWGHRLALLRAGAAAHCLSLTAGSLGLGGVIVAGMVPSALRSTLDFDGYTKSALVSFVAGHELESR